MIKQINNSDESFMKIGRMEKSPLKMNAEELKDWRKNEAAYVRNYLFSIGQPLVHKKEGIMIAEYNDGRIVKL